MFGPLEIENVKTIKAITNLDNLIIFKSKKGIS